MYTWQDFPEERIREIRKETKCVYWHEERMLAVALLKDATDQNDIIFLMRYEEFANVQLEKARVVCRNAVAKETAEWFEQERRKSQEEHDAWMRQWREDLRAAAEKAKNNL